MDRPTYIRFADALVDTLAARPDVVGLVAVGSFATGPDEYSDHDFFVVVRPGEQEAFRRDLSWLPDAERIALSFRETEHGLKVVYDDGHLLEFAVFDEEELGLAKVNRYRVLLDRAEVGRRMAEVRAATVRANEGSARENAASISRNASGAWPIACTQIMPPREKTSNGAPGSPSRFISARFT